MMLYNLNVDLVDDNVHKISRKILSKKAFILKILSKKQKQFLVSITDSNSVVTLRKIIFYNPTKILSIVMCKQNFVKFCPFTLKII